MQAQIRGKMISPLTVTSIQILDLCHFPWSCNVGRGNGVWELFDLANEYNIHVILIQDDGLIRAERNSFYKYAASHNYRV